MRETAPRTRLELRGVCIAPGSTLGQAHPFRQICLDALEKDLFPVSDIPAEIQRLDRAFHQTLHQLKHLHSQVGSESGRDLANILEAQMALLEDAGFLDKIRDTIRARAVNTEYLIAHEIRALEKVFHNLKDEAIRSRFLDVQDVHHRLLRNLLEIEHVRTNPFLRLSAPVVLVADRMLPSDVALLDLGKILGIVIEEGSLVSHVAIIAKSLGIPAITEVHYAAGLVRSGEHVLLQADAGKVIVNPTAEDVAAHEKQTRRSRGAETSGRKAATAHTPCRTADGEPVTLDANVGSLREVEEALAAGADGIGLLRSEFFYLACQKRPTEEIETAFYRDVLRAMHGRPVTIRLLDLGADKSLPYLHLPKEENPQLGIRGVRMLLHSPELLHHHLRNILQASDTGPVRILVPFVATLRDLDRIQAEIQAICREERVPRQRFRLGIMVELPAVAMDVTPFLPQVDFLSVGTNDLVQYTFAASREDRHLEEYRYAHHPVILRLIHGVAEAARVQGKPVTVCGEMASDPALAPLLVGLGIRTLSMNAGALGAVRARIRKESLPALQQLAREALGASRAEQIPPLLQKPRPAGEPT